MHINRSLSARYFLFAIIALFSGCKKDSSNSKNGSFFSSINNNNQSKQKKQKNSLEKNDAVAPFLFDQEDMKTFALDDSPATATQKIAHEPQSSAQNQLFAWEQVVADESKEAFEKLYFDFNKYVINPDQHKALKSNIKKAKKMIKDGKLIVIEGHACHSEGSSAYNLALSEKRARSIAKEFAQAGINASLIKIAPRGQEMPIRKGGNRQEQKVNRRVETYAISQ